MENNSQLDVKTYGTKYFMCAKVDWADYDVIKNGL
jgi:hypothetical protein